jgi:hypothetical protein
MDKSRRTRRESWHSRSQIRFAEMGCEFMGQIGINLGVMEGLGSGGDTEDC